MKQALSFALVLALLAPGLTGCDKKKGDAASKTPVTAPTTTPPPVATPALTPTTPAAAVPPITGATADLKLPLAQVAVGTAWTKTDDLTSNMQVDAGVKKVTVVGNRHYVEQQEVLEVDGDGVVTKVKATFSERQDGETVDGKARTKPTEIAGKSYIASAKVGGALEATHADGSPVSPAELTELTDALDDVGKPRVMDHLMADHAWKVGETYDLSADQLAQLAAIKPASSPRQAAIALTLRSVDGGVAVFEMKTTMQLTGKAELKMDMTGTVNVDVATGRPASVKLEGPIAGTASGMAVSGTMNGTITYAYSK